MHILNFVSRLKLENMICKLFYEPVSPAACLGICQGEIKIIFQRKSPPWLLLRLRYCLYLQYKHTIVGIQQTITLRFIIILKADYHNIITYICIVQNIIFFSLNLAYWWRRQMKFYCSDDNTIMENIKNVTYQ